MKKTLQLLKIASAMLFITNASMLHAQISLDETNNSVTTNFNGWNGTLPAGFSMTGELTDYKGADSSLNSGGLYAVPDLGFGYQPSGSADTLTLTATYKNDSELPITSIAVSYEAFRIFHRDSRIPQWSVAVNGTVIPALKYTYVNSPDIYTLSHTVTGLNILPGATFTIQFRGGRGPSGLSGSTPKYGLNNVYVKAYSAGIALSLNMSNIALHKRNDGNVLSWKTFKEEGQYTFDVEKSIDGYNFYTIASITGNQIASEYAYLDAQIATGAHYYRVAIHHEGQLSYSNTVKGESVNTGTVQLYPNPAMNTITLRNDYKSGVPVHIIDVKGKIVYTGEISNVNAEIDIQHLSAGQYILNILADGAAQSHSFIKK